MKKPRFIQNLLMGLLNCMPIGSQLIIERLMIYLLAMGFFLIMNLQEEAKHLLQKKLQRRLLKLKKEI